MVRFAIMETWYIASRCPRNSICQKCAIVCCSSRDIKKANPLKNSVDAQVLMEAIRNVEDDKVDIVYICTPNHLHYSQIKLCFSYHKHVICENQWFVRYRNWMNLYQLSFFVSLYSLEAHKTCFTP